MQVRESEGKTETEVLQGGQRISAAKVRRLGRQAKKYEKLQNEGVLVASGLVSPPRMIIRTPPMKSPLLRAALDFQFPAELNAPSFVLGAFLLTVWGLSLTNLK